MVDFTFLKTKIFDKIFNLLIYFDNKISRLEITKLDHLSEIQGLDLKYSKLREELGDNCPAYQSYIDYKMVSKYELFSNQKLKSIYENNHVVIELLELYVQKFTQIKCKIQENLGIIQRIENLAVGNVDDYLSFRDISIIMEYKKLINSEISQMDQIQDQISNSNIDRFKDLSDIIALNKIQNKLLDLEDIFLKFQSFKRDLLVAQKTLNVLDLLKIKEMFGLVEVQLQKNDISKKNIIFLNLKQKFNHLDISQEKNIIKKAALINYYHTSLIELIS